MIDTPHPGDDDLIFLAEPESTSTAAAHYRWRIMIVDDDPDVHSATTFALGSLEIQHHPLSFLHAYSAAEAREMLRTETNIAVILLDVVMEEEDAGLQLVSYIRKTLNLTDVRIILRTGQPGYAPEIDAIRDYDINDYKTKSELTRTKLYTAVTSAIRSYEQICAISASRRGLEMVIQASTELASLRGMKAFASGVLVQIAALLRLPAEGLVCVQLDDERDVSKMHIIAAAGQLSNLINQQLSDIPHPPIVSSLHSALQSRHNIYGRDYTALYFASADRRAFAVYLAMEGVICDIDKRLLEVFCSDISVSLENVLLTSQLHNYAFYDPLTGLFNRLKLLQMLEASLAQPQREDNVLALIDIDHFAETNDALGHRFGDALLCSVAERLGKRFSGQLARIGGDTFALFGSATEITPDTITNLFQQPFQIEPHAVQLAATTGFLQLSDYEGQALDALKDTNIALKRAKLQQRGGHAYFTRDMEVEIRERVRLMHALRDAFARQHLFLVYQPQVDLHSGKVIGTEALLRWKTESGSFVPPDQFIPIAEYSGLILSIGEWGLRLACCELVELRKTYPDFIMAINVSQAQFSHPLFMDVLHKALRDTGAPPDGIELEITESMAMQDPAQLYTLLAQIKQMGLSISIDDFGTGFSSLSYLQKLDVDKLKIDRAFVKEILDDPTQGSIASMVVQLGRTLGLQVIAEGVETEFQAETLRNFGCHQAQGYLYGRPMPRESLYEWLDQQV